MSAMDAMIRRLRQGDFDGAGFHFASQVLLFTAVKIELFQGLAEGARSAESLAVVTGCSARGVRVLLDCLAAMQLVEKKRGRYQLNELSRRHFVPGGADYVGGVFSMLDPLIRLWLTLPRAMATGKATTRSLSEKEREALNLGIVDALFQAYRACAWRLAERCGGFRPKRILDVAAGSAVWSIPFATRDREAAVTAIDFAEVLDMTRTYTRRFGVARQYRFVDGDIAECKFGRQRYDLALLGHICHSEGAAGSRALFGKCFRALRHGGRLLVIDYLPDEGRKKEILPLILAVNALLGTDTGDTFTFSEYRAWLLETGFRGVHTLELRPHSPVVVALKG
jgi:ubiquinone/menaquinone biosynthesis C-methylase UbiE